MRSSILPVHRESGVEIIWGIRYSNPLFYLNKIMEKLNKLIQEQFAKMCASGNLFRVVHSGGEVWNKYDGKCHICQSEESRKGFKDLCIDHCHDTLKVRGLLCNSCNVGLGCFKDNSKLLKIAIDYLSL